MLPSLKFWSYSNFSCKTEQGPPSRVRNLQIKVTDAKNGKYNISWDAPERPNGPILGYNITYDWTREGFPSSTETTQTTQLYQADIYIAEGYTISK